MDNDRWNHVDQLLQSALDIPAVKRDAYLRSDWRASYAAFVRADGLGSMPTDDLDAYSRPGPGVPVDEASLARLVAGCIEYAAMTCERRGANPPRRAELPTGWPG